MFVVGSVHTQTAPFELLEAIPNVQATEKNYKNNLPLPKKEEDMYQTNLYCDRDLLDGACIYEYDRPPLRLVVMHLSLSLSWLSQGIDSTAYTQVRCRRGNGMV